MRYTVLPLQDNTIKGHKRGEDEIVAGQPLDWSHPAMRLGIGSRCCIGRYQQFM